MKKNLKGFRIFLIGIAARIHIRGGPPSVSQTLGGPHFVYRQEVHMHYVIALLYSGLAVSHIIVAMTV